MTVIAAYYTDPQNYAMAADSGVTFGTARGQPVDKLYRWGPIFFGLAGGWGICQEGARYLVCSNVKCPAGPEVERRDGEDGTCDSHKASAIKAWNTRAVEPGEAG